jgi:hypothetical protein
MVETGRALCGCQVDQPSSWRLTLWPARSLSSPRLATQAPGCRSPATLTHSAAPLPTSTVILCSVLSSAMRYTNLPSLRRTMASRGTCRVASLLATLSCRLSGDGPGSRLVQIGAHLESLRTHIRRRDNGAYGGCLVQSLLTEDLVGY